MQINKTNKAFTLVELMVVVIIIIILGTIVFISLQGYSRNARDGARIADINNIRKSLEIFIVEKGLYPTPDNSSNITYSGVTVWIEGTIGDNVITNLGKISKKPIDPLTTNEYTYSITSSKKEYQIGAITEAGFTEAGLFGYLPSINQVNATNKINIVNQANAVNAANINATAMIRGNYNEKYVVVQGGSLNGMISMPSIIASNISHPDLQEMLNYKEISYDGYSNLPHSYNSMGYTMTGGFDYTNPNPLTYSGGLDTLLTNTNKLIFIDNLKEAYIGTIIQGEEKYQDIINIDTTTNQAGAINLVNSYINANIGGIKTNNSPILPMLDTYLNCEFNGGIVIHSKSITAYQTASVPYGNTCITEQRLCTNGTLSGTYTYPTCITDGATGTFNLSQTTVNQGTPVTIINNCIVAPTSYSSSDTSVATVAGNTITTIGGGTTDITPIGGACGDNNIKTLTVYANCTFNGTTILHSASVTAYQTSSVSYGDTCITQQRLCNNGTLSGTYTYSACSVAGAIGTFNLSQTSVIKGTPVTITNNCSVAPTSYSSSNTSVATVSGNTITTIGGGTTNITPVGGACANSALKTLTVSSNNCLAGTKVGINAIYTYPALNHLTTTIGNGIKILAHGTINYSSTISCNNGITSVSNEIPGTVTCTDLYTGTNCEIIYGGDSFNPGANCKSIKIQFPSSPNGLYWIDPDLVGGLEPFQAYCDMTTNGGGWTLVAVGQTKYTNQLKPGNNAVGVLLSPSQTTHARLAFSVWNSIGTTVRWKRGTILFYTKHGSKAITTSGWVPSYGREPIPSCSKDNITWKAGRYYHIADCYNINTSMLGMFWDGKGAGGGFILNTIGGTARVR